MKIYAPVKDANGVWASVRFVNGVGETDNPRLIEWFKNNGYTLEMETCVETPQIFMEQSVEVVEDEPEDEMMGYADKQPDFDNMTPNELIAWGRANGFGSKIKNTRNKEKLIKILRG